MKLNHAFKTYATACQYASKEKVNAAIDKLMKRIQKNPSLLVQFAKAAEESIYGPRAEVWIDELYVKVLESALASKKFPKSRRAKYEEQLKQLHNTAIGGSPAPFEFKRANGDAARYFPMATPTIIFFGDPSCDDCRMARLRMESNVGFSKAIADGKLNLLYIIRMQSRMGEGDHGVSEDLDYRRVGHGVGNLRPARHTGCISDRI